MTERIATAEIESPIGPLLLGAVGRSLCLVEYADKPRAQKQLRRVGERLGLEAATGSTAALQQAEEELSAYFAGELSVFETLLQLAGTPFQLRVWNELLRIPAGETRSYAAIARSLGDPAATRAVGTANGANPISILVPCHRVVRTGGALGGYGGGLDRKRWLLDHERETSGAALFS